MRIATLAIAVSLASCGEPAVPDQAVSGTRLALRRYTFTAGSDLLDRAHVHDLARDEDCSARRWSDGRTYCTPDAGDVVYTDGHCVTPIARVPVGSTASYAAEYAFDDEIARLYRVGAPLDAPTGEVWRLERGACVGTLPADAAATFALADEQPRDAFVQMTSVVRGEGRLQIVEEMSKDGLVLPARYRDRVLGAECAPDRAPGAPETRCVPVAAVPASYFADAACTEPVAEIASFTPPSAISYSDRSVCTVYAAVGDDVPAAALRDPDNCTPRQGDPARRYVAAGAALDLAALSRTVERSVDRIRLIELEDGSLTDSLVYDAALGVDCQPALLDGSLRCVPDAAHTDTQIRYTDAACLQRVDVASLPVVPCSPDVAYVVDSAGTWRHIDRAVSEPLYQRAAGGCVASAGGPGLVAVSEPIATDELAAVGVAP